MPAIDLLEPVDWRWSAHEFVPVRDPLTSLREAVVLLMRPRSPDLR
jgi:hypothetical protein